MKASIQLWLFYTIIKYLWCTAFKCCLTNILTAQTMFQFHRQSLTKLQGNALMLQIKGLMLGMTDEKDAI